MRLLSDEQLYIKALFALALVSGISYICVLAITQNLKLFSVATPSGNPFMFAMDYHSYMNATGAFLRGENPYAYDFKYFPFVIFFFYPLTLLSFAEGYLVMSAISILLLAVTVIYIARLLHFYGIAFERRDKVLLFFAIFFFYPWLSMLVAGQVGDSALLCFLSIFLYYMIADTTRKGYYLSNFALLAATFLKVFPAIFVVFEVYLKRWKSVLMYCAFLVLIVTVSIITLGIPIHINYLQTLTSYQTVTQKNGSIYSILFVLVGIFRISDATAKMIWIVVCMLSALLFTYYVLKQTDLLSRRSDQIDILVFSAIALFAVALPYFSQPPYVVLLIPSFLLFVYRFTLTNIEKVALILSLVLVAFPMHIWYIGKLLGGAFSAAVSAIYASSIGLLLLLLFVFRRLQKNSSKCGNAKELPHPTIR